MWPHVAAQQGEALVVAMAQQASVQYAIADPAVIAWLQGGLRQAMNVGGATPQQAFANMHAYLQQVYAHQMAPAPAAAMMAPVAPMQQAYGAQQQAAPVGPTPQGGGGGGGRRYSARSGH
uniref:Uncharacterized protein n=1 Tax=Chlamydomonas euryale TaxID=1486919 RepID=A0A7R9V6J4_9CHLO